MKNGSLMVTFLIPTTLLRSEDRRATHSPSRNRSWLAALIDRRLRLAAVYCAAAGVFALFGIIHSPLAGSPKPTRVFATGSIVLHEGLAGRDDRPALPDHVLEGLGEVAGQQLRVLFRPVGAEGVY